MKEINLCMGECVFFSLRILIFECVLVSACFGYDGCIHFIRRLGGSKEMAI